MSDWNKDIIEEFRDNDGNVGGMFDGRPLLLLHHVGAKSGTERVSPLMYQALDNGFAIFASKGGADQNPAWFHNLRSNPETTVEIGTETVTVRARVAEGEEHDRIWAQQTRDFSFFAEYEKKTSRPQIPVVVLEPF
ncbi:MAG: nitroreductase family deazaflavin-dependent oxidoreductase [Actinobacteria bacterium]|nr:nitroreductase family deazaflavin-dependent oxidoreductase [Acidobacteriota bacterium]MCZ6456449.1 nitroreductase family deazaflavin-dependent oxidoreductase [Actinomycetota bacterium]